MLVSANMAMVHHMADRNRDVIQTGLDGLMKRQDTASTEALKSLQQISQDVHVLNLKQTQAIQETSEARNREQVRLREIASYIEQDCSGMPSRAFIEWSLPTFTASEAGGYLVENTKVEAVVAFW